MKAGTSTISALYLQNSVRLTEDTVMDYGFLVLVRSRFCLPRKFS